MTKTTTNPDKTTFATNFGNVTTALDLIEHLRAMGAAKMAFGETNAEACEAAAETIEMLFTEAGWSLVDAEIERRDGWLEATTEAPRTFS